MDDNATPIRAVRLGQFTAAGEERADGTTLVRSTLELGPYPRSIVDALEAWAKKTPDAILIADRDGDCLAHAHLSRGSRADRAACAGAARRRAFGRAPADDHFGQ